MIKVEKARKRSEGGRPEVSTIEHKRDITWVREGFGCAREGRWEEEFLYATSFPIRNFFAQTP
jgi:hypothetical protein